MKHRVKLGVVCVSVVGAAALAVVASGSQPDATDATQQSDLNSVRTELEGFLLRYVETLAGDDDHAIRALYVADDRFTWFTDGRAIYRSSQDVVDGLDSLRASAVELHTDLANTAVLQLSRKHATINSDFSTSAKTEGQEAFAFTGVITMVVERQPDGTWKVVQGHSSTPAGPPR